MASTLAARLEAGLGPELEGALNKVRAAKAMRVNLLRLTHAMRHGSLARTIHSKSLTARQPRSPPPKRTKRYQTVPNGRSPPQVVNARLEQSLGRLGVSSYPAPPLPVFGQDARNRPESAFRYPRLLSIDEFRDASFERLVILD